MADETVNVKIKFDAKTKQLDTAIAKLATLKKLDNRFSSGRSVEQYARNSSRSLSNVSKSWKRSFDFIDAGVKMTGKLLSGFLKMSIKGVIVEMALLSATMVGVHALFVAGQYTVKAYKGVMQLLAQGAAGLTVALSVASAAIREQQAAMFAYRGKGAKEFGSAMNQTRMAMRNMQMDASLATLGIENLNKAYGTMSKTMNVVQLNQSTGAIKALMDFGSAGQDPAKGLEQVAVVIAALSDKKKGISDVITEAKKLGPEMEKALKTANVKTKKDFEKLLFSGELARRGGVAGQFAAVNSTLIGQLKSYMTLVRGTFADFGDGFLEPVKTAFEKIFNVITRDIARILGTVKFTIGADGYFDGFVDAIDKASNWMVKMIREYLPAAQGMFGRMGDWFANFRRGWNILLDRLRPLIDGARVLYKAFDPIWEAIKRAATNITLFRDLLRDNQDDMQDFGERIGTFIDKFSEFMGGLKKMFADLAPFINDMISGFTQVFEMLSKLLTGLSGKGLASALGPMLAFSVVGRQMSGVKGRFMPQLKASNMQVQAGNVQIMGGAGPVSVPLSAGGGAAAGPVSPERLSSGATGTSGKAGAPGAAAAAAGLSSFKTSGGNVAKARFSSDKAPLGSINMSTTGTLGQQVRQMHAMQGFGNLRLRESMQLGAGHMVSQSAAMERIARRARERESTGLGIGETLFARGMRRIIPSREPEPDPYFVSAPGAPYSTPPLPSNRDALRNSRIRASLTARNALDRMQFGARRLYGGYLGAMEYARAGMIDPSTGDPIDIKSKRDAIIQRYARVDEKGNPIGPPRGVFGRGLDRINRARDLNRLYRNESRFGNAYNSRFAQSLSGRMGTSMGLGMLSQYAPEEMRGAMALGGMAAQIDPRLGIAVAGVGGAMQARGAGRGALSGAAGGAAIGAMFGPQGAIIGAGIGALVGGIRGAVNKGNYELKMAREAAAAGIQSIYNTITNTAAKGLSKNLERAEAGEIFAPGEKGVTVGAGAKMIAGASRVRKFLGRLSVAEYDALLAQGRPVYQSGANNNSKEITAYDTKLRFGGGYTGATGSSVFRNYAAAMTAEDLKKVGGMGSDSDIVNYIMNNPSKFGMTFTDEQKKDAKNKPQEFLRNLAGNVEVERKMLEIDQVYTERLDALSKATGKSSAELETLAYQMGYNLADPMADFGSIVEKFTEKLIYNRDQLNNALTDVLVDAAAPYRKEREKAEGQKALNAIGKKMYDISRGGGTKASKMGEINAQMEQLLPALLAASGGNAMKAVMAYNQMFIQGKAFEEGQALEGMKKYFGKDNKAFTESTDMIVQGYAGEMGTQIRARLALRGETIDQGFLENAIKQMPLDKQAKFLEDIASMNEDTIVTKAGSGGRGIRRVETNPLKAALDQGGEALSAYLKKEYGFDLTIEKTQTEHLNRIADNSDYLKSLKGFPEALAAFNKNMAIIFNVPDTTTEPKDTRTPRGSRIGDTATSKLSQTMSRHAEMDGQLSGKRTMTSALRNHALGSINSDHATGSAYDLTGQNLGMYAKLVHQNGGFAEFHGTMGSRHLHVVPGPGPVGDTTSMRKVSGAVSGSGTNITNYYTFEISGGDPESIANKVMEKIKQQERSNRERS